MSELLGALFRRRSNVDSSSQIWESQPAKSCADASHLDALDFTAPAVTQWLQQLEKSPEEDMLQEALAEELAERGSHGPSHAPNAAVEVGAARLQQLAEAVQEARKHLKADLLAQAASREELERREAELQEREKAVDRQQEHQRLQEQARRDYPQPEWMDSIEDTLNVGVVGNSGVGKSLFINKLRRLRPHAAGWAAVGINETTKEPTAYCFPDEPRVRLWDVPGAGTAAVPSESYIQDMGLRYFDKVVVLTAGRFTEMEVVLRAELQQHGVPFFMVRTKVDIDCWNNLTDNGMDEAATVAAILHDFKQNHSVENPYLISNRDEKAYGMPRLMQDLFPGLQRRLDPMAPAFQPGAGVWGESWVLPEILPEVLAGLQGRWRDDYGAVYLIQGACAHVTLMDGRSAIIQLVEMNGQVSWCNHWVVNEAQVRQAMMKGELRWAPVAPGSQPIVWWWYD
mmetsp:Transcript_31160/g.61192  ORF Transcript_31160/g.61192 Transcript_31160/m.61192 type:complete len:455 (+) Transcript_31160:62-1426(+)